MLLTFLTAFGLILGQAPAWAGATSVLIPVERGLWRASEDGKATRTDFEMVQAFYGAGMEGRLSPDRSKVAFMRGPNVWLLDTAAVECRQLTSFGDWDLNANGAQNTTIYGWTLDGKGLVIEAVMADWSGDGPAPEELKLTSLKPCKKVVADKAAPLPEQLGKFILEILPAKLVPIEDGQPPLHSDQFHSGMVRSPDGKVEMVPKESGLSVGKKEISLPSRPMRMWWISNRAIAAMTLNQKNKAFELWIATLPDGKLHGPYVEPRTVAGQ